MEKTNILIVDDNAESIYALRNLLRDRFDDIKIYTAESAKETFEVLIINKIDLLLLDVQLPKMTGFELAKSMKSNKATKNIPIIFISAIYKSTEFIELGFKSGAVDYLTKPIDEEMFFKTVNHEIEIIRKSKELQSLNKKEERLKEILEKEKKEGDTQNTILCVDDRYENLYSLDAILSSEITNLNILKASSGEEALTIIENHTVNLILLDVKMPGMDGFEVARRLCEKENTKNIPIVFITATEHNEEFKQQAAILGAVDFLLKPINDFRLINKIKLYLDKFKTERQLRNLNIFLEKRIAEEVEQNRKKDNEYMRKLEAEINIRKKTEQDLKKAKTEAETANRLKSEFLASMSHEIRTPMNAVLGFSEILNNKLSDKPEYKPFIDGIIKGGKNLISLINDILDLSKIEAGCLEIKPEPVNLLKLIKDIKQIFSVKMESKDLQFVLNIDQHLPNALLLDQTRTRQILFNLVGNAIKFTDTGFISISVKTESIPQPESPIDLYIEIKDTGIGIPTNQITPIFEAFRQVEGQSVKYGGTGLGLPITKRLVEAMNGKITVESEIGKGSIFSIHFKNIIVPDIKKSKSELIVADNIQFDNPLILLVDDIKSNRDVVKFYLEECNCNIFEGKNGQEAVDFIKTHKPDLILMDIQMPVLNGFEATKLIKKQPQFAKIPIIALTAMAMKVQEEKYGDVFDDYLKKPIDTEKLIHGLMKFLPYTKPEQNESATKTTTTYAQQLAAHKKENGKLPDAFIEIYKTEILPLYKEVSEIIDMNDCKKFATKLINAGTKFNIETFTKFGTELMTATEGYQLSKIENLLTEFGEIIRNEE